MLRFAALARTFAVLCLAPALLAVPSGKVWTVAPTGADFTEIQPAVDTAADGDLILVRPGTYGSFSIFDRSLTVFARQPDSVSINGLVRVSGLGADKQVALIDLSATGNAQNALLMTDNQGSVRVRGGTWRGKDQPLLWTSNVSAVRVISSANVSLRGMTLLGGKGKFGGSSAPSAGGAGLSATESNVVVHHCQLQGGDGGSDFDEGYDGGKGGDGLGHFGGFLHLVNSTLVGGNGGHGGEETGVLFPIPAGNGGHGGHGLHIGGGSIYQVGPMHAELMAFEGQGGLGGGGGQGYFGPDGSPGLPGIPFRQAGTATSNDLPGPLRRLIAEGLWQSGQPEVLTFMGQPGDQVYLVISPKTAFQWNAAKQGVQLVGGLAQLKYAGQIGPSGVLARSFTPLDLPAGLDGQTFQMQAWMTQPGSASTLTGPSTTARIGATIQ